jgi:mRNA interferase HigB
MHIIARRAIIDAGQRHPYAASWLTRWWADAARARWENLGDVRQNYPSADEVNSCLIFNVRGNRYRLICRVTYSNEWQRGTLLVKHFLTHAEYDKNQWKKDCR